MCSALNGTLNGPTAPLAELPIVHQRDPGAGQVVVPLAAAVEVVEEIELELA